MIEGEITLTEGGERQSLLPGDVVYIPQEKGLSCRGRPIRTASSYVNLSSLALTVDEASAFWSGDTMGIVP
jgi:glyoxylate utilization-related uncharacterized protein